MRRRRKIERTHLYYRDGKQREEFVVEEKEERRDRTFIEDNQRRRKGRATRPHLYRSKKRKKIRKIRKEEIHSEMNIYTTLTFDHQVEHILSLISAGKEFWITNHSNDWIKSN